MILQKNKFILSLDEFTLQGEEVYPVYKELKKEDTKDSQNMFFRTTINGEVTFKGSDYEYIIAKSPSTIFYLNIIDRKTNKPLVKGSFRYVDMDVDKNKKSIRVGLTVKDGYKKILTNLETEYDLIKLKPEMVNARYEVSNCLQITTALSQTTTNIYRRNIVTKGSSLGSVDDLQANAFSPWYAVSTLWLQEVTAQGLRVLGKTTLTGHLDPPSSQNYDDVKIVGEAESTLPPGATVIPYTVYRKFYQYEPITIERGGETANYVFRLELNYISNTDSPITTYTISLLSVTPDTPPSLKRDVVAGDPLVYPWTGQDCNAVSLVSGELTKRVAVKLYHPNGEILAGPGTFYFNYLYSRLLSRTILEGGRRIKPESDSDIYSDYYQYLRAYPVTGGFKFSLRFSTEPTEYGVAYKEGRGNDAVLYYYMTPDDEHNYEPFIQDEWTDGWSLWIDKSYVFNMFQSSSNVIENSNFFEIGEAIKVLLREIDPSIQFDTTQQYSRFLYGTTGFRLESAYQGIPNAKARILITQKSNTTKPDPDYFAMKAPTTLGSLLDLLKNAFGVYWFIDKYGGFHLEHIKWFENNGSYNQNVPKLNLAEYVDKFNGKAFAYNTNRFTYDLAEEYARYKLSWQEDTTDPFSVGEITMEDTYDDSNKLTDININSFTPDIEYQAIFGKDLTKDGFTVVVAVEEEKYEYYIPLVKDTINGDMATAHLFREWLSFNLPSSIYRIKDLGTFKAKSVAFSRKNTIEIPDSIPILSLYTNLLTEVGSGRITKVSRDIDTDYVTIELEYSR